MQELEGLAALPISSEAQGLANYCRGKIAAIDYILSEDFSSTVQEAVQALEGD